MLRSVHCVLALALVLGGSACVSDQKNGGPQGGTSGQDGAPVVKADTGTSPVMDAMAAAPKTCQEVRICLHNCGNDMTCAGKCVSSAPTAIRQQYQEIQACSMMACPSQDEPCRCEQECFNMGQCFELVDACDEALSDPWCDVRCH
jgi:hypothetical protein